MGELVGMIAIMFAIGGPVAIVIVAILANHRRQKMQLEKQARIVEQMIEKGDAAHLDMKALASALQAKTSIKASILGNLRGGLICGLLGIGFLIFGVLCRNNPALLDGDPSDAGGLLICGGILLAVGLALVICFLVSKWYLKKEIEAEEKALQTNG